jgi:hypothetical protein
MKKRYFLLLTASTFLAGKTFAQQVLPCGSDEMHKIQVKQHPEILKLEAEFEKQFQEQIRRQVTRMDLSKAAKTTTDTVTWYDIPIVVHVIHDYNDYNAPGSNTGDYIKDDMIFDAVKHWNITFAKQNADTATVIAPFKKYIGNAHIRLHLATKDPSGNPTKGITRRRSYLTYGGGDQAKFDDWAPSSYMNIWFVKAMPSGSSNVAAYAYKPATAASIPYYDGVISLSEYMDRDNTINHELGHCLNLDHPWGGTNDPAVACGDDNVDDTPPTKGHAQTGCTTGSLYDTTCARNYFKLYVDDLGNSYVVNYPDTTNAENIMDYTYCSKMFTKGQVDRMHAALNNTVAGRSNLFTAFNLANTGAMAPIPDLKPIPAFTVQDPTQSNYMKKNGNFVFPGINVRFKNQTWNDTLTALLWTFSNGATKPSDTSRFSPFNNSFTEGGWVNVTMKATGNGVGDRDTTVTFDKTVFVADPTATDISNYMQEFAPGGDRDKWVSFNYYNNEFKWQPSDAGMYDNNSIMYTGFDSRYNPDPTAFSFPLNGTPKGDFDDLYSVPVDLSAYAAPSDYCNLNFWYSAASRSATSTDITDTLMIDYSANKGTWVTIAYLSKGKLVNVGAKPTAHKPASMDDWSPMTIALPTAARTGYTTFRFRYRPGVGANMLSSGNNFYMDRVSFSRNPAELTGVDMNKVRVAIVPNPTNGNAYVYVKDAPNTEAKIVVMDVTGKVVYTTNAQLSVSETRIEIPQAAISTSGIYLVQTITGAQVNTQKLVVY